MGWLDDLPRLESLRSLNLADNDLRSCPSALFQLNALTELVLSGNKLSELPAGIGKLRKYVLSWGAIFRRIHISSFARTRNSSNAHISGEV